jgi:ribosomal-protein-alanine N-acetyltransferase
MIIRLAEVSDAEEIFDIEEECFSIPWSMDSIVNELEDPGHKLYFVVEENKQLLAYAGVWLVADEGQITNVAVRTCARREGYGAMLVRKLVKECFKRGAAEIFLEVRVSNVAAMSLYRRLGFTVKGLRKHYYQEPVEDAYIMSLIKEDVQ